MKKEIIIPTTTAIIAAAVVSVIAYYIHKKIIKKNQEEVECTIELLVRAYADNGKSALELYKSLYKKDPVRGKSGLPYCKDQQ
jgi:hypothetical protein